MKEYIKITLIHFSFSNHHIYFIALKINKKYLYGILLQWFFKWLVDISCNSGALIYVHSELCS